MFDNPAVLAGIFTLVGGIALKITERVLGRSREKIDIAADLRKELRDEVSGLREELRKVENELDLWKAKYYELLDQFYKKGIIPDDPSTK